MESVTFRNRGVDIAADIRFPAGYDGSGTYAAVIVGHPISSCKEQTSGHIYGNGLTEAGYITLAFDASHQGHSGGEPRFLEDPGARVEDFRAAVDYLVTRDDVDENRIGLVGICGGAGYAVQAAMTDHRITALGTVVAANYGRVMREGDLSADAAIRTLEAIGAQRTAEARGAEPMVTTYIPNSQREREAAGIEDVDIEQAIDYYKTPRGAAEGSPNKLLFSGLEAVMGFDAFHLVDRLLTQPLQVICGDVPGAFGSHRDGFELFYKARSQKKHLLVIPGATHYDLYDQPGPTGKAIAQLQAFFDENL
ncbi:alpha/beta hydrolase [Rhodococcus hoagii]|nr:alpha/beta hydrolase [Prescottella equi]NKR92644.1 alpha/beta hydrolase [Prescottella equi]NKS66760.1 alpha/beta hydrolase [Prescottella equi]NKT04020.1 alpha/beta hydrolase [Prescottella equi]